MTEKQQQLTFEKGITNVPSDITCSDNALAESIGMIYDDGEHRVIQKPEEFITSGTIPTILYIHKFGSGTRYIGYNSSNVMCWGTVSDKAYITPQGGGTFTGLNYTSDTEVTSVGKTLIISDNNGLHYFLWKENSYDPIEDYPDPDFTFWINTRTIDQSVINRGECTGMLADNDHVSNDKITDWNNLVVGLYAKNKKGIAQKKGFCLPFFVRTAIELYDGTYTRISNPILFFPCVTENTATYFFGETVVMTTRYSVLKFTQTEDFAKWGDIIKGIAIFVSKGIEVHDLDVDQEIEAFKKLDSYIGKDPIYRQTGYRPADGHAFRHVLKSKPEDEIDEEIKGTSIFRKVCTIGLESITDSDGKGLADYLNTHTLENLDTLEQLKTDDYYSRCPLIAKTTYVYNSRLNLANAERGFFSGFKYFTPCGDIGGNTCYVKIETDAGDRIVKQVTASHSGAGLYFFYPDSRAKVLRLKEQDKNYKLTEHPALNGAYYFAGIQVIVASLNSTITLPASDESSIPETEITTPEPLPNHIIQSEVNNPFVFNAEGYFRVGIGEIIGVSSITQALSEGQFGQYPLLAFSSDGIWALSVASTGYYSSVHPISREVCNNAISITQTDGAVFFTSNKGLMVVVGSQVKCVSEQLSGHTLSFPIGGTEQIVDLGNFLTYMASCYIAYDYRDSLLWIFNQSYNYCYVYSIKSGTFSKYSFDKGIKNVVNNYPDYLLQNSDKTVYSLTERPDINADYASGTNFNRYAATMLTRPMKLENALALKTIMKVNHIEHFTTSDVVSGGTTTPLKASLTFRLFASNNLENWVELTSLTGVPWKYYRFRYDFANLKATDRFAGSVIITQERRTNKLR